MYSLVVLALELCSRELKVPYLHQQLLQSKVLQVPQQYHPPLRGWAAVPRVRGKRSATCTTMITTRTSSIRSSTLSRMLYEVCAAKVKCVRPGSHEVCAAKVKCVRPGSELKPRWLSQVCAAAKCVRQEPHTLGISRTHFDMAAHTSYRIRLRVPCHRTLTVYARWVWAPSWAVDGISADSRTRKHGSYRHDFHGNWSYPQMYEIGLWKGLCSFL